MAAESVVLPLALVGLLEACARVDSAHTFLVVADLVGNFVIIPQSMVVLQLLVVVIKIVLAVV